MKTMIELKQAVLQFYCFTGVYLSSQMNPIQLAGVVLINKVRVIPAFSPREQDSSVFAGGHGWHCWYLRSLLMVGGTHSHAALGNPMLNYLYCFTSVPKFTKSILSWACFGMNHSGLLFMMVPKLPSFRKCAWSGSPAVFVCFVSIWH